MEDWAPGSFEKTRVDLVGSSGPRAGPGHAWRDGIEAGFGFVSAVLSPAAAPRGPGCAEAGAELGPCLNNNTCHSLKNDTIHGQKGGQLTALLS